MEETGAVRVVRVYPRMLMGGAEQHVLTLLRAFPQTEMVVPGVEGAAGAIARSIVDRYTFVDRPHLAGTVRACRGADILHTHVINNDPSLGLALQLAGARRVVLTIHNNMSADYAAFSDHAFVVGVETAALQPAPGRVSLLPEGVDVPDVMPPHPPLAGRPLRICEVRRPGKAMAFTLGELLRAGALSGVDVEARVVGISEPSDDPRVAHVGEVDDPSPHLAWADLVLHGSAAETFGRVVYEAMAHGAVPLATPLPAFTQRLVDGEQALLASGFDTAAGVELLRRAVAFVADEGRLARMRDANFRWVSAHASTERMVDAQEEGYLHALQQPPAPRSIVPDDVPDDVLDAFGRIVDSIHYARALPGAAVDALPERPRALAWWLIARSQLVGPDVRLRLLRAARDVLGPRPALLRALAEQLRAIGRFDESLPVSLDAVKADRAIVAPYLDVADSFVRRGDRAAAREILSMLQRNVPSYAGAERFLRMLDDAPAPRARPFAHLRGYARIIVTGPHRSGTTIAAEMIAADTGHEAVREEAFEFYRADLLREVLRKPGIVVQCPALFDLMPELSAPGTAIVLMRRPLEELADSRDRMFSPVDASQLSAQEQNEAQLRRLGADGGDAAALKYALWDRWVAEGRIHHPVEVPYASLAGHPMWVSPDDRRKLGRRWHNRRTQV